MNILGIVNDPLPAGYRVEVSDEGSPMLVTKRGIKQGGGEGGLMWHPLIMGVHSLSIILLSSFQTLPEAQRTQKLTP